MADEAALTLEQVVHYPPLGLNTPANIRFSPDSRLITYLWSPEDSLSRQIWAFEVETGTTQFFARAPGEGDSDSTVSHEEALRRERQRVRGSGITHYAWAEKARVMLIPVQGQVYVTTDNGGSLRRLETGEGALDPQLNPAGDAVAYVRDGELWVLSLAEGATPRQLTTGAAEPNSAGERLITNGLAEFIAQEEMGRSSGFWWSQDGAQLAFAQVDVSAIPPFTITSLGSETPSREVHRYPFAGAANARVKLGVVDAIGGPVRWLSLSENRDSYLARVDWTPDGAIVAQVESRDQHRLDVLRINPQSGSCEKLWSETDEAWINLHDDLRFVTTHESRREDYRILWSSERTGYRHLYLYGRDGELIHQLTDGNWPVDAVAGAHEGWVYFLAGKDTPLERRLYRVGLNGGPIECLTPEPGFHQAVLSPSGEMIADSWSCVDQPTKLFLRDARGRVRRSILEGSRDKADKLGLRAPEFVELPADDGTPLHGAIYRPPAAMGAGPWPVIVDVYGGPHVQQVVNGFGMTLDLRAQYLAQHGYLVFVLDNRGSSRRGHAFESAIRWNLGDVEVRDQVAGIRYLGTLPEADTTRVGVYGWSYGGYMTIMCLLRAPKVFRVGVAGAPVTAWDGYDTHYTERYMGRPVENAGGYRASSAMTHAANLIGNLLLIHGMTDENVHFRHSGRLINALIAAGKPFELLPFPDERHMPRSEQGRHYMERRLVEHFDRHI